jgi:hypothetical protein
MTKWRIIQVLIKLPPQQLVLALLLFSISLSLSTNAAIVIYFKGELSEERKGRADDKKFYQQLVKTKDSIQYVKDTRSLDFMEEQMRIGYTHKAEIDSLKLIKIQKK